MGGGERERSKGEEGGREVMGRREGRVAESGREVGRRREGEK